MFDELNLVMLERVSGLLRSNPRMITQEDVRQVEACGVSGEEAMLLLVSGLLDADRTLQEKYLRPSLRRLDAAEFQRNAYLRAIRFPEKASGAWRMTHMQYEPYELFVRDDLQCMRDGREIVRLGYFDTQVRYPAVLQDGREWMTVTPNEIATMEGALSRAHGHAVAMGLGLGYYAFMASEKPQVRKVTIVERDEDVIRLFERHILPQFTCRDKVEIIRADAFAFARDVLPGLDADHVFVDLWHDVGDGAEMYLRMKAIELQMDRRPSFDYWIETSITSFLRGIE